MRLNLCWYRFGFAVGAMLIALPVTSQTTAKSQPLVIPLQCAGGDCPLLTEVPQTAGMRSGYMRLLSCRHTVATGLIVDHRAGVVKLGDDTIYL
jgi:hypothetical protein